MIHDYRVYRRDRSLKIYQLSALDEIISVIIKIICKNTADDQTISQTIKITCKTTNFTSVTTICDIGKFDNTASFPNLITNKECLSSELCITNNF